jgi:hypothetical protein
VARESVLEAVNSPLAAAEGTGNPIDGAIGAVERRPALPEVSPRVKRKSGSRRIFLVRLAA